MAGFNHSGTPNTLLIINPKRTAKRTDVKIYTAKPGIIIGQGGADIEKLRNQLK